MIARWFGLMVGMIGLFTMIGCWSDDGLDTRYPVTGTVTYKEKPLEKGLITFTPDSNSEGRGSSGTIKDGNYTLTTNMPDDGAFPGKYNVTIADLAVDMNAAAAETAKAAKKGGIEAMPGMVDPAMIAKVSKKAKNNVPAKYSKAATSNLKAEVKAENNIINFALTD
jgi:hypothetical protein